MMDVRWFAEVCAMAGLALTEREAEATAAVLAERDEVLPWIVIRAGGFSQWPQARQALAEAARGFTRATTMRPERGDDADPVSPRRRELYDAMNTMLTARDVKWRNDWDVKGPMIDDVIDLANQVVRDEGDRAHRPSTYILRE
jgi:hypothetical protein